MISPAIAAELGIELNEPNPAVCCLAKCILIEVSYVAAGRYVARLRAGVGVLPVAKNQT
jgi:hypothetical protein